MTDTTLWWIALGLGLVVALVAVALLQTLLRAVGQIEREVQAAWEAGTRVAANTATTWMLGQTPQAVAELKEEALRHDAFLSSRGRP
ncbi:MAG: hypothetical protein M3N51_06590 [Actinomycetota bacterium]|nr:hypothetical protein [Actinomycetota bacterium]